MFRRLVDTVYVKADTVIVLPPANPEEPVDYFPCGALLNFINYEFGTGAQSSSYEVEFYRSACPIPSGEVITTMTLTGTQGARLELLYYDGYVLVHSSTAVVDNKRQDHKTTVPRFNSVRFRVDNSQGLEDVTVKIEGTIFSYIR